MLLNITVIGSYLDTTVNINNSIHWRQRFSSCQTSTIYYGTESISAERVHIKENE